MPRKRALAMFVKSMSENPKRKCTVSGQCFCDGRCMYTAKEWRDLEEIKESVRFTGVDEMKNKIS